MNYKEVIESKYNREAWQKLLYDIFRNKISFWNTPSAVHVSSRLAKEALNLGKISLVDGESIAIYEVELSDKVDIERNRRGIRDMLTTDWRNMGYAGAFMFCYRKDESILRFSYVSETWGFNKQGEYEKMSTNTKRYTYLLGEGRGCRTAIEQFGTLKNSKQTLSDITNAFSVETLTKQFYKDLFEWYQWAIEPSSNVSFPNNTGTEDDDREDLETKVIRLITRIMFVWFIKQKDLVPQRIFDIDYLQTILKEFDPYSQTVGNYYNAILQNLFFATLNRAIEDEQGNKRKFATNIKKDIKTLYRYAEMFNISENDVVTLFSEVPFLNGGLFECLDKTKTIDGVEQAYNYDGFSRNDKRFADGRYRNRAIIPNNLFFDSEKGLISILSRYNFTIEENSPEEQQVALDPELLGKVFENLLGAYNPETKETARNQSGSFYTPREIVNYMVDESLIAYLGDTQFVRSLFNPDFTLDREKPEEYQRVAKRLKAIKILDPACGSGAFPMGLLNRMIDVLCRISPNEKVYDLKLAIIENCIYGSDIQSIAAQITKLRFFISLICDCEKDASKPNFGIPTLPNLETKFVAANSLIAKKKQASHCLFENPDIEPTKQKLIEVRHEHFSAKTANRKSTLREKDKVLREKLARLLADDKDFAPEDAIQLAAWNPYDQNTVAEFFDPAWMFGVSDGFDIVIGNPPYIQLQNNGGELAKLYEPCDYKTFAKTGDIYCLFYERGWQLLKPKGHLCYITSNKWMRAGYGEKTRGFFAKNTNPQLLIDFAGVKIFESATVDTNILLFSKEDNEHKTLCAVTNKQNKDGVKNLSVFVQQQGVECDFTGSTPWVILSPIEQSIKQKIEAVGTPLKDWDINIPIFFHGSYGSNSSPNKTARACDKYFFHVLPPIQAKFLRSPPCDCPIYALAEVHLALITNLFPKHRRIRYQNRCIPIFHKRQQLWTPHLIGNFCADVPKQMRLPRPYIDDTAVITGGNLNQRICNILNMDKIPYCVWFPAQKALPSVECVYRRRYQGIPALLLLTIHCENPCGHKAISLLRTKILTYLLKCVFALSIYAPGWRGIPLFCLPFWLAIFRPRPRKDKAPSAAAKEEPQKP